MLTLLKKYIFGPLKYGTLLSTVALPNLNCFVQWRNSSHTWCMFILCGTNVWSVTVLLLIGNRWHHQLPSWHIIETAAPIQTKFGTMTDHQILFMGGPNRRITNPRWRTAAVLNNRKMAISVQRFDWLTSLIAIVSWGFYYFKRLTMEEHFKMATHVLITTLS